MRRCKIVNEALTLTFVYAVLFGRAAQDPSPSQVEQVADRSGP